MKSLLSALGAVILITAASMQGATHLQSGPRHTSLLELFTSEGCSSCPPAEARFSALKGDAGLWRSFVPVAFHVDYWDRLGWRDRYSLASFTARQNSYAQLWHSESVYTPAFVLDGKELKNWAANLRQPNENSGILSATSDDGRKWTITFAPSSGTKGQWDAHVAWLGADISSPVGAGENEGRKLEHDFVVLGIEQASIPDGAKQTNISLTNKGLTQTAPRYAVAIWVTRHDELTPVQATGGWIALR
jgi:hypothetical protein